MAVNENEQDRVGAEAAQAAEIADEQGLLFTDDVSPLPSDTGYRGPTACNAAGITYRQLDYWARTGLVEPTVRGASGSGTQRLYSFRDILLLKVVKRLLDAGISLQQIRTAVAHLRERGTDDLTRVTLMSDGASVYECTSNDEVIDLLQGGQGVFGIAIGGVWREIEGTLAELPSERTAEEAPAAQRRARRPPRRPPDRLSAPPQAPRRARSRRSGPVVRLTGRGRTRREPGGAEAGGGLPVPGLHRRGAALPGQGGHQEPGEERVPGAVGVHHVVHRPDGHVQLLGRRHRGRTARAPGCRRPARCRRRPGTRMKGSGSAIPSSLRNSTSAAVHPVAVEGGRARRSRGRRTTPACRRPRARASSGREPSARSTTATSQASSAAARAASWTVRSGGSGRRR